MSMKRLTNPMNELFRFFSSKSDIAICSNLHEARVSGNPLARYYEKSLAGALLLYSGMSETELGGHGVSFIYHATRF